MASTVERRRQLARQRWEKQQARRATAAARVRRRRRVLAVSAAAVVLVGAVAASALVWPRWLADDTSATETDGPPLAGECFYGPAGVPDPDLGLPPTSAAAAATATLTLDGEPVTVELLSDAAPCTVNSLVHLAGNDYFDATSCHRLTSSASLRVLQCGDPAGDGTGGPGYEYGLENTATATYPAGTVAMAHRADEPDSNGSQFFLVYEDSELPPEYTVFGRITAGIDVVEAIAARGTADGSQDGTPVEPVILDDLVTAA